MSRSFMTTIRVLAAILALTPLHALAQGPDDAIASPHSGRDTLNYPPSPQVQYQHLKLVIDIPDMATPRFSAIETLTIAPIAAPIQTLTLDAKLLEIQSVTSPGRLVHHRHDGSHLVVTFDPPIEMGRSAEVVTAYSVNDPPQGLIWTLPSAAFPGRPAQIHSQGQSELNSYWFPIHDFPNIRLTSEIIATVPEGFRVVSNGRLLREPSTVGNRTTFHWSQDKPHAPYLVSLVVGAFDVVDLARQGKDTIPIPVYAPPGRGADAAATFARTPEMIALFSRLIGQPYPWDQYAQTIAWDFEDDGMENTSATTLWEHAIQTRAGLRDKDSDDLISHELAHQWFGDLLTCKSWEHVWLNEGFATFFESVWNGLRAGPDAYFAGIQANLDSVLANDKDAPPDLPAMVSKSYTDPDDVFIKGADPYAKGSIVLHMLRERLGDDVFWNAIRAYAARYRFRQVETGDFRRVVESVSGESLEQFFAQWCTRTGVPSLDVKIDWQANSSSSSGDLVVTIRQTQRTDGAHPAFAFDLPIWIRTRTGEMTQTVSVSQRNTTAMFALDAPPIGVSIDPRLAVAANITIHQPPAAWIALLRDAPTIPARIQAARAVGADPAINAREALLSLARETTANPAARVAGVRALAARRDAESIAALCNESISDPDTRLAIIEAAGSLAGDTRVSDADRARLTSIVSTSARGDTLPRSRAAALRALGSLRTPQAFEILSGAIDIDSDGDAIRAAAIDALHALGNDRALPVLARVALPGQSFRARVRAIHAIADLSRHDSRGIAILRSVLHDRSRPVWLAAGEALASLGDPEAISDLRVLADSRRDPGDRARIREWISAYAPAPNAGTQTLASADEQHGTSSALQRWAPIASLSPWAETPALLEQLDKDPAGYFGKRGLTARAEDARIEVALDPSPDRGLGGSAAPIIVTSVRPTESGSRVRVLTATLDEPSASRLRELTRTPEGHIAFIVDGRIVSAPRLVTPMGSTLLIPGNWTPQEAATLSSTLLKPGALELRWTLSASSRGSAPAGHLGSSDKPE